VQHRLSPHRLRVRPARPSDRAGLLDLWERSVRATHDFLTEADISALRPEVAAVLAGDAVEWWVLADDDDGAIGFLGYTPGSVEALFIAPEHRGCGAGTLLVAHAEHLADGALCVDVNEQNGAAVGFYEARGFAVVGRSPTDAEGRPFPVLHMQRVRA
jgi:putative acetyltransferase